MTLHDIAITLIPKIGARTASTLIEAFGSAETVMTSDTESLSEVGVAEAIIKSITQNRDAALARAAAIVEQCHRSGITILIKSTEHYPRLLAECPDSPNVLYVRGELDFNNGKWLSVVGTRSATQSGIEQTDKMVADIARNYPEAVIVSGLAFGIDKAAHCAAIRNKIATVAVMAGWVDDITPRANYNVARTILDGRGAIVSDMPPGTVITGSNFLSRNRIIAGLSSATIVVESAARGGSLVTADIALSYDRELFAIPGRIDDDEHQGTNMLIKSSKAILYQDISDIAQALSWVRASFKAQDPSSLPEYLRQTFETMPDTAPFTLDEICEAMGVTTSEASSRIIQLEIRGFVKSIQGRMYQKAKY